MHAPHAPTSPLRFSELVALYLTHARTHYRRRDGSQTGELDNIRSWSKHLAHFNDVQVDRLTRHAVRAWLDQLIAADLSRGYINQCLARLRRMLNWAAALDYIDTAPLNELSRVRPLLAHRSPARETTPTKPVAPSTLTATLPFLQPTPRAVVQLLQLTGSRVGELLCLRSKDIEQPSPSLWWAHPPFHKTQHHHHDRAIPLDRRAIAIVAPLLRPFCPDDPLFPSPRDRSKPFSRDGLYTAIQRAAARAGVERWSMHQVRHLVATQVRDAAGLDAAQALLGHASPDTTQHYARLDRSRAARAVESIPSLFIGRAG